MEKLLAAYRLLFSEHLIRRIRSSVDPNPEVLVANFNGVDCFTRLITLRPRPQR